VIFFSPPNEAQLDALREVANVGCGHAANALSKLVGGRKVEIDVPRVVLTQAAEMPQIIGGTDARVVITALDMQGELEGRLLLVLQEGDAQQLSAQLLNGTAGQQVELSAICEAGNIVASACLNAIGSFTGLRLLPSTPTVSRDLAGPALQATTRDLQCEAGLVMVLEARFITSSVPAIGGQLLVLPRRSSVDRLLQKLGL